MTSDKDTKSAAILEITKIIAEASIEIVKLEQENAELKRLLKLAVEELVPDICDYCVFDGSKQCEEENAMLGCGNTACQFVYWRHYDEVKGLIENGNEVDTSV